MPNNAMFAPENTENYTQGFVLLASVKSSSSKTQLTQDGDYDIQQKKLTNVAEGTLSNEGDIITKSQLDTAIVNKPVRNIPKFKDSCDVMELLLFSRKMADRLPKRPQSPFRGSQAYFKTFHEAYTIFLSGQGIESHIGSVS